MQTLLPKLLPSNRRVLVSTASIHTSLFARRLKDILSKLDKGEAPDRTSLKSTLRYAASILSTISEQNSPVDG